MNGIKKMLLGIAIMMAVIVFHMFCADGLVTDLIAIIGLMLVIIGYNTNDNDSKQNDQIRICEQGGKINDSDIIHINDCVHKHYLVFGKIGVCNSKQES